MTLNRLSRQLVDRGVTLQVIHPRTRSAYQWGLKGNWETMTVAGLPIPGYPEAQVGLPRRSALRQAWQQFNPQVVHVATEGVLGRTASGLAREMDIRLITSFHTNFHEYARHYHVPWMKKIVLAYLRGLHSRAEATLVPDPDLIRDLSGMGFKKCEYFGRGVDGDLFHPARRSVALRESWGATPNDPVVLHVSRVAAEKNMRLVLDRFVELKNNGQPRLQCVVVGDGPERKSLERRYPEARFVGMKFDVELAEHYASADLFAFASETETFGNVVLEAMASGCTVLTYDYAAGRQLIDSGRNGVLARFGDKEDFRTQMSVRLADLPGCREMGQRARQRALEFPWARVVDQYVTTLKRVMA